ncbi:hypothetical protein NDU88_005554 [Pleurodeles waltl]|uniref:Uncharacterized protein n=1 Tax=Pleurodeles waltl TaxID=8319 RepID=A0AAV7WB00_PLEWA|nr:hypothetical protein NDU88_005554 [Pleurodeles waltl]
MVAAVSVGRLPSAGGVAERRHAVLEVGGPGCGNRSEWGANLPPLFCPALLWGGDWAYGWLGPGGPPETYAAPIVVEPLHRGSAANKEEVALGGVALLGAM